MKQYRITSEHFVPQGETGDDNAVMHPDDLAEIKRLAGIPITEAEAGVYTGQQGVTNTDNGPSPSPIGSIERARAGSNISYTAQERNQLEREFHARPGDELWFIINFTKPYFNGSLRDKVEEYLKAHPELRPRQLPGD
jgi:hypothetical protein